MCRGRDTGHPYCSWSKAPVYMFFSSQNQPVAPGPGFPQRAADATPTAVLCTRFTVLEVQTGFSACLLPVQSVQHFLSLLLTQAGHWLLGFCPNLA